MNSKESEKNYKTSEAQRAANKRYKEKMKESEEYKEKQKVWTKNYYLNNRDEYNAYQREYAKKVYHLKKEEKLNMINNNNLQKEINIYFPCVH